MTRFRKRLPYPLVLLCLLFLLCSCSTNTTGSISSTSTPQTSNTSATSTPTAATTPAFTPTTLPTQTDCPAEGTARAAVMPPLPISSHASIVYSSVQGTKPDSKLILAKYDTVTTTTTEILQTDNNIRPIQLSANGQWILLSSYDPITKPRKLQLLRLDGKEFQTLYCSNNYAIGYTPSLSPDQKNLLFSEVLTNEQVLYRLELSTGKLSKVLSLANDHATLPIYDAIKWISNTSLYVTTTPHSGVGGEDPFCLRYRWGLYLVNDILQDVTQQNTNLTEIKIESSNPKNHCTDYDMQSNQQIFFNDITTANDARMPDTIKTQKIGDTTASTIYNHPGQYIRDLRMLTPTSLIFSVVNAKFSSEVELAGTQPPGVENDGIWKINTDGSGLTRLVTMQPGEMPSFPELSYTPRFTVSHDGSMYAFSIGNRISSQNRIVYGSISGGEVKTIANVNNSYGFISWTQV